jgi:hypothetical protein
VPRITRIQGDPALAQLPGIAETGPCQQFARVVDATLTTPELGKIDEGTGDHGRAGSRKGLQRLLEGALGFVPVPSPEVHGRILGYGKRTALEEFRPQNRGGKGIILIDASDRNGPVVGIALVKPGDEIMLITDRGQTIRTAVSGIRETGRNAQGVKVMSVGDEERVVAFESIGESRAGAALDGTIPPPPGDETDETAGGDADPTSDDDESGAGGDGEPQG